MITKKETLEPGDPAPDGYGKNWMPLFHTLPEGVHKIIIEAEQISNGGNNFMLDNIEITTCDNMRKFFHMLYKYIHFYPPTEIGCTP